MTAPTPPADAQWGIQWEVFIQPDGRPGPPQQPEYTQPYPVSYDDNGQPIPLTEDQQTANAAAYAQYLSLLEQWREDITAYDAQTAALISDDANWRTTVFSAADEATARTMYPIIKQGNEGNPQTRNFILVWALPVNWTAAPE
ncbi:hypothetical protein [Mycolicibacterium goodii]|uniref:Bacteriophage protein n=1 Tax=Mycolicibacterium goodii TaxID=134601 RepID=A0ABS6HNB4_MYCGD|nr:hypothetical protein [Mycolicibacterium goodii]YP_009013581.1 hypothetical protein DORI_31 [Mycobacterium phage Dori]AER47681.1 hypothetical protein DORI_31 [Mycobacterium phage Dori]MBU8824106.1 hypothetical protein [Mycolicibacterium goodii]MBU8838111.1 hypothetical protein [Mycolicibacterium goodii]